MVFLVHQLIAQAAVSTPLAPALWHRNQTQDYASLQASIVAWAGALQALGLVENQRVALYLPKQFSAVWGLFATMAAGGVAVPINPALKAAQVQHIVQDSGATILISHQTRVRLLAEHLRECPTLQHIVLVDAVPTPNWLSELPIPVQSLQALPEAAFCPPAARIDADMALILYTSGSTGLAKGVMLSHANLIAGAQSVVSYLHNTAADRLLAALPLSFDYGLSQLTCAFMVGASVVLLDYLVPQDVVQAVRHYGVTGLAAVPSLWQKLAPLDWPEVPQLRYLTNSGGALPVGTTQALQQKLPDTAIFLMYGLTEAFRSTYLPPEQLQQRPDSIGQAIPNAQILLVNAEGERCGVDEPGELVHRGALVAMGYWNNPQATAACFRPLPTWITGLSQPEIGVWSGDIMRQDAAGYLYFIGRRDAQIKTAGYRVSPDEVEAVVCGMPEVTLAVAQGVPDAALGQAIIVWVQAVCTVAAVQQHCRLHLPNFMQPKQCIVLAELPLNPNGKPDRAALLRLYQTQYVDDPV